MKEDSLSRYFKWIYNATQLNPNNVRFEGFKSAGKIGTIENSALQNNIMDLYQETIPALLSSTKAYIERKNQLYGYLQKNHQRLTDSTSNFTEILNTEEAHNICSWLTVTQEITARYDAAIKKSQEIIEAINKQYPE
ncbi:MAG: hypothetical protein ABIN94_06740 [Ferruginibacter sp.]